MNTDELRGMVETLRRPLQEFGSPDWARQKEVARRGLLRAVPSLLDEVDRLNAEVDRLSHLPAWEERARAEAAEATVTALHRELGLMVDHFTSIYGVDKDEVVEAFESLRTLTAPKEVEDDQSLR